MRNKLIGIALFVALSGATFASQVCEWSSQVGRHAAIKINGITLRVDRPLAAKLSTANEAAFLPAEITHKKGSRAKWMVLRTASRSRGDSGFCGSGHEDRLILLHAQNGKVASAGEFTAQSCLSSISMDVDQLHELTAAFQQDPKSGDLTFQQSVSSEVSSLRHVVKIQVREGRVKIEKQRLDTAE